MIYTMSHECYVSHTYCTVNSRIIMYDLNEIKVLFCSVLFIQKCFINLFKIFFCKVNDSNADKYILTR